MRVALLTCLAMVAVTSCACLAGTAPPASIVKTKIIPKDVVCPTENEEARRSYNAALQQQQEGRLRDAETSYLKAIELDPGYCDAMDDLGLMLRIEGATDQAISWYKRSLSVKPDNPVAHQNLAVAYQILGDAGKAVAEFQWLTSHEPENPEGYYGLGNVKLAYGEAEAAVGPLMRAEELYRAKSSPLLADAQYGLGVAYYRLKEYAKARSYLEIIYPGRESDPNINYMLGVCFLSPPNEDRGKARKYLLTAKKLGVDVALKAKDLGDHLPDDLLRDLGN